MDDKIKELTEKLYHDGVARGEARAQEIITEAQEKADALLRAAQEEAARIVNDARRQAEEIKRATAAEIKMSAGQAMNALKQQIVDALLLEVVDKPLTAVLSDPTSLTHFLTLILQSWNQQSGHLTLEVLLPENKREDLDQALRSALQVELARGIRLSFTRAIKAGFQIQPQGSTFKISLTDEDFKVFFKEYLRPKTRELLFGK
jgi:V/A-type H+-transporting ATPase subunit E